MKKRILRASITLMMAVALILCAVMEPPSYVEIEDGPVALSGGEDLEIKQMQDDLTVIPDQYNTGVSGNLVKVELGNKVGNVQLTAGVDGTKNILDFYSKNKNIEGTVTIENYDFSKYRFVSMYADKVKRKVKVVFNNCKFAGITTDKAAGNVSFVFNNCTIKTFYGSNATLDGCQLGGSCYDAINPFQNVTVKNCFISDMGSQKVTDKSVHSDGTQIYGAEGITAENITFKNCRFEVPPLTPKGSLAYVNACIMLQVEFSNADTISFSDCIINGGGYSIYARTKYPQYSLSNVNFNNIRVGCAKKYGSIYYDVSSGTSFNSVQDTDALYVASVWKENGSTHFSVSNDTDQERTLVIITDQGEYEYTIPACKKGSAMTASDVYSDMPFDLDIEVPENCKYAVCYDATVKGSAAQIRFMNWGGGNVRLSAEQTSCLFAGGDDVVYSGACGKNVTYSLNKAGVLTLEGSGPTYYYKLDNPAPWSQYRGTIKKIQVGEGITILGNQLFRDCSSVESVVLPEGITIIGSRCFNGCSRLTEITLPASVKQIGEAAIPYKTIQKIIYKGDSWSNVELLGDSTEITDKVIVGN